MAESLLERRAGSSCVPAIAVSPVVATRDPEYLTDAVFDAATLASRRVGAMPETAERASGSMAEMMCSVSLGLAVIGAPFTVEGRPDISSWDPAENRSDVTTVERALGYVPAAVVALPSKLAQALERVESVPPSVTVLAARLLDALRLQRLEPDRIAVTRSGGIACTLVRGRRYAILDCDSDGDIVLTLTDRTTEDEADTLLVTLEAFPEVADRIEGFLEG
ncbi:MAG: hypothetical protein JW940_22445 [Polyangiaceae bacterium]|nr:hypothetical protein [Polyangiaceae bacterium]